MSHEEESSDVFYYFSDEEDEFIRGFLTKKGYEIGHNTVCGSCCGMYADEYWVDGIGGKFKLNDRKELGRLMKEKGYKCSIYDYTISANPEAGSYCDDVIKVDSGNLIFEEGKT